MLYIYNLWFIAMDQNDWHIYIIWNSELNCVLPTGNHGVTWQNILVIVFIYFSRFYLLLLALEVNWTKCMVIGTIVEHCWSQFHMQPTVIGKISPQDFRSVLPLAVQWEPCIWIWNVKRVLHRSIGTDSKCYVGIELAMASCFRCWGGRWWKCWGRS